MSHTRCNFDHYFRRKYRIIFDLGVWKPSCRFQTMFSTTRLCKTKWSFNPFQKSILVSIYFFKKLFKFAANQFSFKNKKPETFEAAEKYFVERSTLEHFSKSSAYFGPFGPSLHNYFRPNWETDHFWIGWKSDQNMECCYWNAIDDVARTRRRN